MSVNSKHIATFILGTAVGLAASKYMSMTDEEKDKLTDDLKAKANSFKDEAEAMMEKAKAYFEELKEKGATALKDNIGEAENIMNDFFNAGKQSKA
jgi:gas vesicle protein